MLQLQSAVASPNPTFKNVRLDMQVWTINLPLDIQLRLYERFAAELAQESLKRSIKTPDIGTILLVWARVETSGNLN